MASLGLGRRDVARFGIAGALTALGAPSVVRAKSDDPVTFFSYATYTDPQLTSEFTKQSGTPLKTQNSATSIRWWPSCAPAAGTGWTSSRCQIS